MSKLIGTGPNQVPSNADLGTIAYQDSDRVDVGKLTADSIGIGTKPDAALHIRDGSDADNTLLVLANDNSSDAAGDSSKIMFQLSRSYVANSVNDAGYIKVEKEQAWDSASDRSASLVLGTRNGADLPEDRVWIKGNGNVGIRTSSPNSPLEIATSENINSYSDGAVQVVSNTPLAFVAPSNLNPSLNRWGFKLRETTDGDFSIHDYRQSTTRLLIDGAGKVGIGTTDPQEMLNIHGDADSNLGLKITRGGETHGLRLGVNNTHAFLWTTEDQDIAFGTNNQQRVTVTKNGDLEMTGGGSIGWANYTFKEESGYLYVYNGTTKIMRVDASGNVAFAGDIDVNATL